MRILKLVFSAVFFFLIIIVVGFFLSREALLYMGTSKIKSSLRELYLSQSRGTFFSRCQQLGGTSVGEDDIIVYQLRFLSSNEFVLEAVCNQFSYDPILIKQVNLPQFVTKVAGTSGFSLSPQQSGIEIQVFEEELTKISEAIKMDLTTLVKTKALVAEDGVIISDGNNGFIGGGPVTNCNGYGYECCQDVSQVGVGDRITGLVDCEQTCYSSCAPRPIILAFNTNPIFDPKQRSLSISNGETVEFTYVADAGDTINLGGVLNFGDGKKLPVTGLAGQSSHTYSCTKTRCEYLVQLSLEDNWGVKSASTGVSRIRIVVGK